MEHQLAQWWSLFKWGGEKWTNAAFSLRYGFLNSFFTQRIWGCHEKVSQSTNVGLHVCVAYIYIHTFGRVRVAAGCQIIVVYPSLPDGWKKAGKSPVGRISKAGSIFNLWSAFVGRDLARIRSQPMVCSVHSLFGKGAPTHAGQGDHICWYSPSFRFCCVFLVMPCC